MRIRLEPRDDYLHDVGDEGNFSESRYYNFYDPASGTGGWMRIGNRPNEGYAEVSVCIFLPDGRVGFVHKRPAIDGHESHDSGGLRFDVVKPFEEHAVAYDGDVFLLDRPRSMADPKAAFAESPRVPCRFSLRLTAVGRPWGGEKESDDGEVAVKDPEKSFLKGHFEQHMRVVGDLVLGDESSHLSDAYGLRDHSWGPRSWQAIWWYRWLTANFGADFGFTVNIIGSDEGPGRRRVVGFLYDRNLYGDDHWVSVREADLATRYDDEWFPTQSTVRVRTDDRAYDVTGDPWSSIPLRHRRNEMTTRITENMTRWSCDGKQGAGLSEYMDQLVDGIPVGTRDGY